MIEDRNKLYRARWLIGRSYLLRLASPVPILVRIFSLSNVVRMIKTYYFFSHSPFRNQPYVGRINHCALLAVRETRAGPAALALRFTSSCCPTLSCPSQQLLCEYGYCHDHLVWIRSASVSGVPRQNAGVLLLPLLTSFSSSLRFR
jgi:hypothetical protein